MERKLDSDIEEIRNVLLSGSSQVTWNKQDVWARIEQKESKKRVWPFALAACVALMSLFIFWKVMPSDTSEMVSVMLPEAKSKTESLEVASIPIIAEKQKAIIITSPLKSKVKSLPIVENKQREAVLPTNVNKVLPVEMSLVKTEIDFRDIEIKPVAIPEKTFSGEIDLINRKEVFGGKKITLIIPDDDKAAVRSNVKVVRFIQKVGEYNRTGDWEPDKKNKIGELWAKFIESTKTNEKSEL